MTNDDYQVFRTNYLVRGLAEETIRQLADLAEVKSAPVGQTLIVEGGDGTDLLSLLEGTVEIRRGGETVGHKGPGDVLGEVALLDRGPRSAEVVAATPVRYVLIDGTVLTRFMAANVAEGFLMLLNLSRVLTDALREATHQIEDLRGEVAHPHTQ